MHDNKWGNLTNFGGSMVQGEPGTIFAKKGVQSLEKGLQGKRSVTQILEGMQGKPSDIQPPIVVLNPVTSKKPVVILDEKE